MFSPFKFVKCYIAYNGNRVVYWQFLKQLPFHPLAVLTVLYAINGSQWLKISDNVLLSPYFLDTYKTNYNKIDLGCYRLHLKISDSLLYYSLPCAAGKALLRKDQARAQNFVRLAVKEAKLNGMHGMLLKRKHYGLPCPDCKHFSDDTSVNEHCSTCLGTGIVGGYYTGIPLDIIPEQKLQMDAVLLTGIQSNVKFTTRVPATLLLQLHDVWVDNYNNQRYCIDSIYAAASFKHVPVLYVCTMNLIELTDVMHSLNADTLVQLPNVDWILDARVNYD